MKKKNNEVEIESKNFSLDEIPRAITKLERRIEEVKGLKQDVVYTDQRVKNAEMNIQETIREIFGSNSPEFNKHQYHDIWSGGYVIGESEYTYQRKFQEGIEQSVLMLVGLIARLNEKRVDLEEDPDAVRIRTFNGLNLHPRIFDICSDLFNDGHYSSAVFEAAKSLINYVKEKSRKHELDGTNLVRTVFSKNKPILTFNKLKDQTDLDEQEGIMHLFEGVVMGIRNPRGHGNITDNPDRAMDYIILISLLAFRLDSASRIKEVD
ncbi:hypothetical protein Back11_17870 [Paenibacillus baekrokdamisoli]|uniref:Uncharacterized protein n=1 Tax=Paenibacillus baekrokdamisoli TaxID=1712516 RepID=A0A3G9IQ94_9BACL|nr:TIGR02391 family protein [Paenibacillus baekrokdamisoli]MBB3073482.1 uncharacterized protein (TIGR02391 family) [Paenibacillus baekrokdamisoli]BBH20442.1 hypothetical protein Back11_17870 [Paenibacillus baekrokdamisoli]